MIDMHAHICSCEDHRSASQELLYRSNNGIRTFFSTGTPREYRFMVRLLRETETLNRSRFCLTFGIHPWYADQWDPKDWGEFYKDCTMIGEIGMDDLWCDVPLDRQQKILEEQLVIAADLKKPIVLHTKGCEARIACIIKDYPYPVLVHWYSGDPESLKLYIDRGCFFTLGPDAGFDRTFAMNPVLSGNVPTDRLFLETDGLGAISWAYEAAGISIPKGKDNFYEFSLIERTLTASAENLARRLSAAEEEVLEQMDRNLAGLLSLTE